MNGKSWTSSTGLTRAQERVLQALLTARTLEEAAAQASCSERSVRSWLREPTFSAAYREARRQIMDQTIVDLQRATESAVAALKDSLESGSDSIKLRAAIAILEHAHKWTETEALESRIRVLEERVNEPKRKGQFPGADPRCSLPRKAGEPYRHSI